MYVDKVKYTAQYENGYIKSQWIGVDVALTDSDDPEKAFQLAQEMTEHFHKKANNPHLEGTTVADVPVEQVQEERPTDIKQALKQDMMSCKEVKVLESYRLLAKSDPELQLYYDMKMNELIQNR